MAVSALRPLDGNGFRLRFHRGFAARPHDAFDDRNHLVAAPEIDHHPVLVKFAEASLQRRMFTCMTHLKLVFEQLSRPDLRQPSLDPLQVLWFQTLQVSEQSAQRIARLVR